MSEFGPVHPAQRPTPGEPDNRGAFSSALLVTALILIGALIAYLAIDLVSTPRRQKRALIYCGSTPNATCKKRVLEADEYCDQVQKRSVSGRATSIDHYATCMEKALPGWRRSQIGMEKPGLPGFTPRNTFGPGE